MNKQEFLDRLRKGLSDLPCVDAHERLNFYSEMIDDRMEEGVLEEDAVLEIGSIESVIAQITADMPQKAKKRKLKAWEIVLLALGSPVWFSLAVALFAVVLSLYVSLWAVIISIWAAFGAVAGCTLYGLAGGICIAVTESVVTGIALFGGGVACFGLSIFVFFGCKLATEGTVALTKLCVKKLFRKKEEA